MRGVVVLGDRQLAWREFPDPEPGPGEAVVRMRATAVCGSDLHQYHQSIAERNILGWNQRVIGHEPCGIVERVGAGPGPRAGDRVVVYHHMGCGVCTHCLRGEPMFCARREFLGRVRHGSNADLLLVPSRNCLPLPDALSYEEGALLACNVGTAYAAMKKAAASGRGAVVVVGLGPVGLYCVQVGRAMGAQVIGVDPIAARREMARALGALTVIDPSQSGAIAEAVTTAGGQGPVAAVDTSGVTAGQQFALEAVAVHGRVVFVGVGGPMQLPVYELVIQKELHLMGSWIFKMPEWQEVLDFVRQHHLPITAIVTHRLPAVDAEEGFRIAEAAQRGKVVLLWGEDAPPRVE